MECAQFKSASKERQTLFFWMKTRETVPDWSIRNRFWYMHSLYLQVNSPCFLYHSVEDKHDNDSVLGCLSDRYSVKKFKTTCRIETFRLWLRQYSRSADFLALQEVPSRRMTKSLPCILNGQSRQFRKVIKSMGATVMLRPTKFYAPRRMQKNVSRTRGFGHRILLYWFPPTIDVELVL